MSIRIKIAETPEELDQSFFLRHRVFVEEDQRFPEQSDRRFVDRFDVFGTSAIFIAIKSDEVIGTLRFSRDHPAVGLPTDHYFDFHSLIDQPDAYLVGSGQFCLDPAHRGSLNLVRSLFRMGYYWSVSQGATHIVAPFNPQLKALMRRIGFRPAGDIIKLPAGDLEFLPMMLDVTKVQDSFIEFVKHQKIINCIDSFYHEFFSAGETIIKAGEPGENAFFLIDGTAEVLVGPPNKQQVLAEIEPGSLFGELALLTNRKRTANVVAKSDVEVMVLKRNAFLSRFQSNPEFTRQILHVIADRLAETLEKCAEF